MPDVPSPLQAGLQGRYTIERELGRGGMWSIQFSRDYGGSARGRFARADESAAHAADGSYVIQPRRSLLSVRWWKPIDEAPMIERKEDIKAKLGGASPDFADALAMAVTIDAGVIDFGSVNLGGPIAF